MQQLATWHQTKWGLLTFGVIELAAAYGVAYLAVNSGALWQYALAAGLLVASIRNFVRLIRNLFDGHKTTTA
jgi:hypothetical protein